MNESRPNYRGLFPGTFTMGNVVCGFLAILSAFEGNITTACWFVILAGLLDALDGKVARLSGGTSQFGIELDSLADFLSFGVAPAVIVHTIKLSSLGKWGWVISIVFIMAASYRLARYNVMADSDEKKDFLGLPVPVAAFALVSYIIFSYKLWGGLEHGELLVSMIVLMAILMVTQIEYDAIPDRFETKANRIKLLVLIATVPLLIFKPRLLLFPLISLYILFGMVKEFTRLFQIGVDKVRDRSSSIRKGNKEFDNE